MRVQSLKCHRKPFEALWHAIKTHETRLDDGRNYRVGDYLRLREWDERQNEYTGRVLWRRVSYLSRGPEWGLPEGLVVMSVRPLNAYESRLASAWKEHENPLDAPAIEETRFGIEQELWAMEKLIAIEYEIPVSGRTREEIMSRIRSGEIPETALVQRWISYHSALERWKEP